MHNLIGRAGGRVIGHPEVTAILVEDGKGHGVTFEEPRDPEPDTGQLTERDRHHISELHDYLVTVADVRPGMNVYAEALRVLKAQSAEIAKLVSVAKAVAGG